MDDATCNLAPSAYRCPGERYAIDHATHLARLATYFPACRVCEHRHDFALLPADKRSGWAELEARACEQPRFMGETFEAPTANEMTPAAAGHLAAALASTLVEARVKTAMERALVLVGADGHWNTAEHLAATSEALVRGGCDAAEVGAVTAPALATAAKRAGAAAALWIGHAAEVPRGICIKIWGPAGRPWSSPGGLDAIRRRHENGPSRPARRGGSVSRVVADAPYLEPLRPQFHGLRPLRFALLTTCEPVAAYLDLLTAESGCRFTRFIPQGHAPSGQADVQIELLAQQVVAEGAHGGLEISGDGERLRLVDERGSVVESDTLLAALADFVGRQQAQSRLVLDETIADRVREVLVPDQATLIRSPGSREAMCAAMESSKAMLGASAGGRYWFAGEPAAPDALLASSLLLVILSASDRPLSQGISRDGGSRSLLASAAGPPPGDSPLPCEPRQHKAKRGQGHG